MRYRHRFEPGHSATFKTSTSQSGVTSSATIVTGHSKTESTYDEVVPNFKARSAKGEIFNNEFTSLRTTHQVSGSRDEFFRSLTAPYPSSAGNWSNGFALEELYRNGSLPFPAVSLSTDASTQQAQIQALASVNKTGFDLGTFLGEWDKTKRLHRDLGNALVKLATESDREARKIDVVKRLPLTDSRGFPILNRKGKPMYKYVHDQKIIPAKRNAKARNSANLYLMARFGIMPLLNDVESAFKLLLSSTHKRETARGNMDANGEAKAVKQVAAFNGLSYKINCKTTRAVSYRYGILYETSAGSRLAGNLGLTRPLSTLWELTPYSFVIDRFIQVGQWLDALQPTGGVRTLAAWVSCTETIVHSAIVLDSLTGTGYGGRWTGQWSESLIHTSVSKTRRLWDMTVPALPSVNTDGITSTHALDYVALVLQKLTGKKL